MRPRIELAESIAEIWNRAGINYAITHGLESYPDSIGRDLDVLVQSDHVRIAIDTAREVLKEHNLTVVHPPHLWGDRLVAVNDGEWADAFEIHTMRNLSWRNVVFTDCANVTKQRGLFKIDPWSSFVKRILLPLLASGMQRFHQKPQEFDFGEGEQEAVAERLPLFCGQKLSHIVCEAVNSGNVENIERVLPELRRYVIFHAFLKAPLTSVRVGLHSLWRKAAQLFSPCGPVVALVGPDGIGKSTLISVLVNGGSSIFTKVVIRHWRPGLLPRLGAFAGNPAPVPGPDGFILPRRQSGRFHWLRLFYYLPDFVIGHFLKDGIDSSRQRVILYDRCALDMVVDPLRYGLRGKRGTRLLWRLIPKPDLVVLLYDEPGRIHYRKPELEIEEIDRQLKEWLRLVEKGEVDTIIRVDASPEKIVRRMNDLVVEAFIEKNGGPITEDKGKSPIQWLSSILTDGTQIKWRVDTGASPNEDSAKWRKMYDFSLLALKDGRGYLVPVNSSRVCAEAFNLYNAQNLTAKVAKKLVATGMKTGVARRFMRKVNVLIRKDILEAEAHNNFLLEHLKEVLERRDLTFGISLGTPGPHRKPVIQVLTHKGETHGYVKVGWNEPTNSLVQSETEILKRLETSPRSSFTAPRVIYDGWWNGRCLCVQSGPPKGKIEDAPHNMMPQYLTVLKELAALHTQWVSLKESNFWKKLLDRIGKVTNNYYGHILQQGISKIEKWIGDKKLPFHFCHGDFAPWNAKLPNRQLFLFDWEYATLEGPLGWDLFHFFVQTRWLLKKWSPGRICSTIEKGTEIWDQGTEYMQSVGVKETVMKPLFLLYLTDRLAFYASEDPTNFHTLRRFAIMINLCILNKV